jgi:type I restriction enzyme S subunit
MPVNKTYRTLLDELPSEWEIYPIQRLGKIISGGTPSSENPAYWGGEIPWVTPGEISRLNEKRLTSTDRNITEQGLAESGANLIPPESLLVTTRATLGLRAINSIPVTTNQGFKSIQFSESDTTEYYYYWTEKLKPELERLASGTTFLEISGTNLKQVPVPYPPRHERAEIARILDTIDNQIRRTEDLIAKLEQVKQGLLTDLLARGIDENGELRPSPVVAPTLYKDSPLGLIPREWNAAQLGTVARVQGGYAFSSASFVESGVPLARISNFKEGGLGGQWARLPQGYLKKFASYLARPNDVLIAMSGATTGKMAEVMLGDLPMFINQRVGRFVIEDESRVSSAFLPFLLGSVKFRRAIDVSAIGGAQPNISGSQIESAILPFPGLNEQARICKTLQAFSAKQEQERALLAKLREHRVGLMDDLLTGRVRVTALLDEADRAAG